MSKSKRIPTQAKPEKRILAVRVKRIYDEDGVSCHDYLGEYAQTPSSEFSIDRAHTEDCAILSPLTDEGRDILDHAAEHINSWRIDFELDAPDDQRLSEAIALCEDLINSYDPDCDCRKGGRWDGREYRYFNPSFNYIDKNGKLLPDNTAEEVRKYVREDYNRMEDLNAGRWYYLGIRAEADVQYPAYGGVPPATPSIVTRAETITSMGLWGIASDSEKSYFVEVQDEELASLAVQLCELGFNKRAIATAFKSIKEVNE